VLAIYKLDNDKNRLALAKADEDKKIQKEHAAQSGARTRDLSQFGFVGDGITRGEVPSLFGLSIKHTQKEAGRLVWSRASETQNSRLFLCPQCSTSIFKSERTFFCCRKLGFRS
jgi:hypothetical protein